MIELFDNAPSGFFSFHDDGHIFIVNQTFCNQLGYEKKDIEGRFIETVFTIPTKIFFQTHFFPMLRMHGKAEEIFMTLQDSNKEHIPVLLNAKRMNWQGKELTVCSYIIVQNRKKFEEELIAARKEAEKALHENSELIKARKELQKHAEELDHQLHLINQKNQELSQINHVVTHNLKEPLRKILFHVDRLHEQALPGLTSEALGKLMRASHQLKNIVTGLQQYVWLDDSPLHFSEVNLSAVLAKALDQVNSECGEGSIEVKTVKLPTIEADEEQLQLVFYHVLSNAVKFKKNNKAHVEINGTIIQKNRFRNVKGKYNYGDFLKLEITDHGVGFDSTEYTAAFELFRKYHMSQGVGLGLALCKKITDNHSGSININSSPGEGTTVEVLLPITQNPAMKTKKGEQQFSL